jgi:hypothetical protein
MLSRRELLETSKNWVVAAALSQAFPGWTRRAFGATADPHFFVLVRTFGGMDVTLGLDPWILPAGADSEDMFLEYRPDDIVTAEGLKLGPAALPLKPHAKESLILNGVMMRRDAGHDVINQYMVTGRGDGKAAALPVELAFGLGTGPFGVLMSGQIYLAGKAMALSSTQDLLTESDQGTLIATIEERLKLMAEQSGTSYEEAQKKIVEGKTAALGLMDWIIKLKQQVEKPDARHAVAAAFASGAALQAQIDTPFVNLDTHAAHEKNHLTAQKSTWEWVADLFKLFKSMPYGQGTLFDATTFMVISEWSRTPALNAAKGKDHNPFTNSVLLAGKKIRGGRVLGASRLIPRKQTSSGYPDHVAWPFDYKTGTLATGPAGASFFYPENVIQSVGKLFGSPAGFAPVAANVLPIPGI